MPFVAGEYIDPNDDPNTIPEVQIEGKLPIQLPTTEISGKFDPSLPKLMPETEISTPAMANPTTTQQLTAPAASPPAAINAGPKFAGSEPDNSIRATPQQATTDMLNLNEQQKALAGEEGNTAQSQAEATAKIQADAAAEKQQQAADYAAYLKHFNNRLDESSMRTKKAYEKYAAAAGSLKDPASQYWKDRGPLSNIASVFAGFTAGLAGPSQLNGFLQHLNNQIHENYEAHRQNIQDLYQSAVQAGKIPDTIESHNRFMDQAKLKSYELSSAHIVPQLESIKAQSAGQVAKIAADKAINGLNGDAVAMKQALAAKEAAAAAAALAAQRAKQKEVRDMYQKQVELHNKDMGEDESRIAAAKDLESMGYDRSALAPVMSGVGVGYDAEKGQWIYPQPKEAPGGTEPSFDESGKLVLPTHSATGKLIKPEELNSMRKEYEGRTVNIGGKPQILPSVPEAVEARKDVNILQGHLNALAEFKKPANLAAIVKGTTLGSAISHLPIGGLGDEARKNVSAREAYNTAVIGGVAGLYKLGNSAYEPRGGKTADELALPFQAQTNDTEASLLAKMNNYEKFIAQEGLARLNTRLTPTNVKPTPAEIARKLGGKEINK